MNFLSTAQPAPAFHRFDKPERVGENTQRDIWNARGQMAGRGSAVHEDGVAGLKQTGGDFCNRRLFFGKADLPIYGMAASLSALTLTTDFQMLDGAIESLKPYISLPPNHAPFRSQLRIKTM